MSDYDNDPRVKRDHGVSDEAYQLDGLIGGDRYVYQSEPGVWAVGAWNGSVPESTERFATADEAIRSLIGEPQ